MSVSITHIPVNVKQQHGIVSSVIERGRVDMNINTLEKHFYFVCKLFALLCLVVLAIGGVIVFGIIIYHMPLVLVGFVMSAMFSQALINYLEKNNETYSARYY